METKPLKGLYRRVKGETKVFKIMINGNDNLLYFFFGTDDELNKFLKESKEAASEFCDPELIVYKTKDITGQIDLSYKYQG